MRRVPGLRASVRERGFFLIGLIIVLAIIAILAYKQVGDHGENVKMYTDRGKDTACMANRVTFQTTLAVWQQTHQGEAVTVENIRKSGTSVPTCPSGGVISLSPDGSQVYCSIHNPAPEGADKAQQPAGGPAPMTSLPTPQPTPNLNE